MSSKVIESIANNEQIYGVGVGSSVKIGNHGIQGVVEDIGVVGDNGQAAEAWVSSYQYISEDLIPVPLKTPKFFELMPNSEEWMKAWISIWTKHAVSITGFDSTLSVEVDEQEIGGTGEFMSAIKDVKKARTNITLTAKEKEYKSLSRFVSYCITYGQRDYRLKKPLVTNFISDINEIGGGYSADYFTGTVLFIEPDNSRMKVVDAYYSTAIFFKGSGEITAQKNISEGGSSKDLTFEFASITFSTDKVFELAEKILPTLTQVKLMSSDIVLPTDGIDANISELNG